MEADVFPEDNQLLVAHNRGDIKKEGSLDAMYIHPILKQFTLHRKTVLDDTSYTFSLLIDIKEDPAIALKLLIDQLNKYPQCFDRRKNPKAVQVIITGNQGDPKEWNNYPSFIYFDGKPYEDYSPAILDRVAIISDNFFKYFDQKNSLTADSSHFLKTIKWAHSIHKPIRFWAAPDNEAAWLKLTAQGVDIINTDHVDECRRRFSGKTTDH